MTISGKETGEKQPRISFRQTPVWQLRLEGAIKSMGAAERRMADYLLADPKRIVSMTITEVAEGSGISEATIVRFCRHIGYKGFQHLKIAVAEEVVAPIEVMYDGITDSDSVSDIKKKVFASSIQAIQDTMLLLDDQEVEKAVSAILQADRIDIYGMGGSGVMAMDLQHKMLKIGIRTNVYTDSHMQALSASQLKRRDVAIGISYSGTSRDTCEALELAKEAGATTIGMTHYAKSPLFRVADITLVTTASETMFRSDGIVSQAAQLAIIDTLYVGLGLKMGKGALENLEKGRKASVSKGY